MTRDWKNGIETAIAYYHGTGRNFRVVLGIPLHHRDFKKENN